MVNRRRNEQVLPRDQRRDEQWRGRIMLNVSRNFATTRDRGLRVVPSSVALRRSATVAIVGSSLTFARTVLFLWLRADVAAIFDTFLGTTLRVLPLAGSSSASFVK